MRVLFCESCGAPLDAPWAEIVIQCRYCGSQNLPGRLGEPVPPYLPDDGRPRVHVGGRTYVLEAKIASGDSCEVYRARWAMRLGELVVVKVLRSLKDADLLRREWAFLTRLVESPAQGSAHFARRLPQPITLGPLRDGDRERLVAVYRWQSGFVHTLEEVGRAWPGGVDGRVLTWIFKRLLELLSWTHRSGVVHGAVLPPHVLIHPFNHGATLVGWGAASPHPTTERLPAVSRAWRSLYTDSAWAERRPSPAQDIAMAARCVLTLANPGLLDRSGTLPGALGRLVRDAADEAYDDAWALKDRVDAAARSEYGPSRYSPLVMPGWRANPS